MGVTVILSNGCTECLSALAGVVELHRQLALAATVVMGEATVLVEEVQEPLKLVPAATAATAVLESVS
jgi:hypothetical protein